MRKHVLIFCALIGVTIPSFAHAILIERGITASYRFDLSPFGPDAEINSWNYAGPANNSAPVGYDFLDVGGGLTLEYGTRLFAADITRFTFINPFSNPVANFTTGFGPSRVNVQELFISVSYFNDSFTLPDFAIRIENLDPRLPSTRIVGELVGTRFIAPIPVPEVFGLFCMTLLYSTYHQRKKADSTMRSLYQH